MAPDRPLSLEGLLARCHRGELSPLAAALRVSLDGLSAEAAGVALARGVRRAGGNPIANLIIRRGDGPSYPKVLAALASDCEVALGQDEESTELLLLAWWLREAWGRLSVERQVELWGLLGMPGTPPERASVAVAEMRDRMGRPFGYRVGLLASGGVAQAAGLTTGGPLAEIAAELWPPGATARGALTAVLEVARLRQSVRHRVTVALFGGSDAGKESAVRGLFGLTADELVPLPGSTDAVAALLVPGPTAMTMVTADSPDALSPPPRDEVGRVAGLLDVALLMVDASKGVTDRDVLRWRAVEALGLPALCVLNKIDLVKPQQRGRFLLDARAKLGGAPEAIKAAGFAAARATDEPSGLDALADWLEAELVRLGKDPTELPWNTSPAPDSDSD